MTKAIQEQINNPSKKIFWILAVSCGLLVASYFFSIIQITVSIRENTVLANKSASLTLEVNGLEYQYLQAKNAITLETAKGDGFIDNSKQIFVSKAGNSESLSLNTNEI